MKARRVIARCVAYGIVDQACDNVHSSIGGAPDHSSQSVFFSRVERARDEKERWRDRALKDALERSQDHQASKVLSEADAKDNDAPDGHTDPEETAYVEPLNEIVARGFGHQVGDLSAPNVSDSL